ncbi:MAG: hypothetical protein WAM42_20745, partial [Candidatus Nitrosopolaris sp.]
MTEDNSVNNDLKDAGKVVEDQKDPDKLLRGLSSEGQEEGNGVDPDQEFHDLGQLAVQSGKNGRNENGGNGGDNGSQDENTSKGKSSKNKRNFMAYKYSNRKKGDLHEAVILSGKPAFLKCENGLIKEVDRIEEDIRIINPPHVENYPYEPYEFKDMDEVLCYVERARNETIDSLYLQAKQIAFDYNDQRKEKLILLAIETVWSYLQDKFPTTHYDIVLGGNGCGKSSYGNTFGAVGYRVVNLTDPNAANINRILGCVEIGQCTIVSDETGAIDKHPDLMSILKTGYESKGKTSKINDYTRQPEFFSTYCFKMIIAERMPNLRDARGVQDRSFTFTTYKGRPKYDIKETLEPQGNAGRQERLDKLNDFRKLMLIYRLLHFKDEIQDISVNVEGREKELSKPIIQLFYGTKGQKEVEATLQTFLDARNEKKEITLEPIVHSIITALIEEFGTEISVKQIWQTIKSTIEGHSDEKKPNEYHTLEYGTIYNNTISSILEQTFGGRPRHRRDGNVFIFDPVELARVGRALNLSTDIQTKICEGCEGSEASIEEDYKFGEHKTSHLREDVEANLINNNQREEGVHPQKPSQPSQPSQAGLDTSNKEDAPLKLIHSPAAQVLT